MALGSDATCREAAIKALAAFMRAVGKPGAMPLLVAVAGDKLKMAKLEEQYEQFIKEQPTNFNGAANVSFVLIIVDAW